MVRPQSEQIDKLDGKIRLLLFVAGDEPVSRQARENLLRICKEHLADAYDLQIIDVLKDYKKALESRVLVTPTLIITQPEPRMTIIGNLSDTHKVLALLRPGGVYHVDREPVG
jgi:circadian clock protein KaiB